MFEPGQIIKAFVSKKGNEVTLRFPKKEDVDQLLSFINTLSKEDTFISFSGEVVSKEEEEKYVKENLDGMKEGTHFILSAFIGRQLVGSAGITRRNRRCSHVADVHISVAKEHRGEGIGRELLLSVIVLVKKLDVKMLGISVFANNPIAFELYKKVGFTEHGRFPKAILYKGEFIDSVEMHKEL